MRQIHQKEFQCQTMFLFASSCLSKLSNSLYSSRNTAVLQQPSQNLMHEHSLKNVHLQDSKKQEAQREVKLASEQLAPVLSQGVLVARHVDRPWQVAWVHVAQPELLLQFIFEEMQSERSRKQVRKKRRVNPLVFHDIIHIVLPQNIIPVNTGKGIYIHWQIKSKHFRIIISSFVFLTGLQHDPKDVLFAEKLTFSFRNQEAHQQPGAVNHMHPNK